MDRIGAGIIIFFTEGKNAFVLLGKESKHLTDLECELYDYAFNPLKILFLAEEQLCKTMGCI